MNIQKIDSFFTIRNLAFAFVLLLIFPLIANAQTPPPVNLKFVTVNPDNNDVTVVWTKSVMPSVTGYSIYAKDTITGNAGFYQGYANGILTTSWTDNTTNADIQSESYTVRVKTPTDSSLFADYHSTVHLNTSFEPWYGVFNLKWTPYIGWDDVYQYEVWLEIDDDGSPFLVASVEGDVLDFKDINILPERKYEYYIKAISGSATYSSTSNKSGLFTDMPEPPKYLNGSHASILEDDLIEVLFYVADNPSIKEYNVLRSNKPDDDFEIVYT